MTTVTGYIKDSLNNPLSVVVQFESASAPVVNSSGVVIGKTTKKIHTDPTTGAFSVALIGGRYTVTFYTTPVISTFSIDVDGTTTTVTIDEVASTPLEYIFTAPIKTWTGTVDGHLKFNPIPTPPAPTTAPHISTSGNQDNTSTFTYQIVWVDSSGNSTTNSPDVTNTAPTGSNNSTRITLPLPDSRVATVQIYRSLSGFSSRYLLATVNASSTHYDDLESDGDFTIRVNLSSTPPVYNTTSGLIFGAVGSQAALWVTDQGIRAILQAQFDAGAIFNGTTFRVKNGVGAQVYNYDTALWHTLVCQGTGDGSITLGVNQTGEA